MKDLVIKGISELLFENKAVVLEGLGVFETKAKKANIDQVQGLVHPPSHEISFHEDKNRQDTSLKDFLVNEKGMTEEAAESSIRSFVGETISQMDKKEIVSLPKLGRLYVDFEKHIQFLPDRTNFSKDAFGLPTLNYFPVLRNKEEAIAETVANVATPIPPSPITSQTTTKQGSSSLLTKLFPWLLGLALIIVLGIFYWVWQNNQKGVVVDDPDKISQMDGRVNTSPSKQQSTIDSSAIGAQVPEENMSQEENTTETNQESTPPIEAPKEEKPAPKEEVKPAPKENINKAPELPPGTRECVIIVGGFAAKENAQRMIKDVTKAGYQAYSDTKGGLSRVGVSFPYKTEAEIGEKLQELKTRFNPKSWVLKY